MDERPLRIYVASSWRNTHHTHVVEVLRAEGHGVYDFKDPAHAFGWKDVAPAYHGGEVSASFYREMVRSQQAKDGFAADFGAMEWADVCVLVLPCGRSAHLEAGWFAGAGKPVHVYAPAPFEPELMYGMTRGVEAGLNEILEALDAAAPPPDHAPSREDTVALVKRLMQHIDGGTGHDVLSDADEWLRKYGGG